MQTISPLMPLRAVMQFSSLSRATIYRRLKEGSFPKPIKIGMNRIAWRTEDVAGWLDTCISSSTPTSLSAN